MFEDISVLTLLQDVLIDTNKTTYHVSPNDTIVLTKVRTSCVDVKNKHAQFKLESLKRVYFLSKSPEKFKYLFVAFIV